MTTPLSLGHLAVRTGVISREDYVVLRRRQKEQVQAGAPVSFGRLLEGEGVPSTTLGQLLQRAGACDHCKVPMRLKGAGDTPCPNCKCLVMGPGTHTPPAAPAAEDMETVVFRNLLEDDHKAPPPSSSEDALSGMETINYNQVLRPPKPAEDDAPRLGQLGATLNYADVLPAPATEGPVVGDEIVGDEATEDYRQILRPPRSSGESEQVEGSGSGRSGVRGSETGNSKTGNSKMGSSKTGSSKTGSSETGETDKRESDSGSSGVSPGGSEGKAPKGRYGIRTGDVVDGFKILRLLGKGGMGLVFLARQEALDRLVAIKVLHPTMADDSEFLERFHREAKSAAHAQHPNVVAVYHAGFDEERELHYIAFEYVDGGSLEDLMEAEGPLDERRVLELIRGVCKALVFTQTQALVHRDIKPANLLLTADGKPKLADLGLARDLERHSRLTMPGIVMGTPAYMAPEQALDEEIDVRSDLYALGVCAWEMLTGKVPLDHPGLSTQGLIGRHVNEDVPDVRDERADVSREVAALIRGLVERDRDLRYPTPEAVVADVDRVLRGEAPIGPETEAVAALKAAGVETDPDSAEELSAVVEAEEAGVEEEGVGVEVDEGGGRGGWVVVWIGFVVAVLGAAVWWWGSR